MKPARGILFDLDGTLLDTAADLGCALNCLLQSLQRPPLSLHDIRNHAGRGAKGLIRLGFNIDETHPEFISLCDQLLDFYGEHLNDTTALFPGMQTVLEYLTTAGIHWGIVTNKPQRFTLPLLKKLDLFDKTPCVISGDSLENRKPHPEPILQACKILNQNPTECIYLGDSEIDVIASKAAGTLSIVAKYGYIPENVDPTHWDADGMINHPLEILPWTRQMCMSGEISIQ